MLIPVHLTNEFRSHKCNLPSSDYLGKLPITLFQFDKEIITLYIINLILFFIMGIRKKQAKKYENPTWNSGKDYITGNYVKLPTCSMENLQRLISLQIFILFFFIALKIKFFIWSITNQNNWRAVIFFSSISGTE